jgi:hypothetical protein
MARKKKDQAPSLPDLGAHRHQDMRKNIPTGRSRGKSVAVQISAMEI